mgnify:CR=1 FL=1
MKTVWISKIVRSSSFWRIANPCQSVQHTQTKKKIKALISNQVWAVHVWTIFCSLSEIEYGHYGLRYKSTNWDFAYNNTFLKAYAISTLIEICECCLFPWKLYANPFSLWYFWVHTWLRKVNSYSLSAYLITLIFFPSSSPSLSLLKMNRHFMFLFYLFLPTYFLFF